MNKTKLIIIFLGLILIMLVTLVVISNKKNVGNTEPIIVYSPSPEPTTQVIINQQEELQAEQNYGKERQRILSEKPWILKMPLKNEDYFLSYDTELDIFNATIYISSRYPENEQLNRVKQRISKDLINIGVDVNKVRINYTKVQI